MIGTPDVLDARILIVDDLPPNVALLEQILRGAGYGAVTSTLDPYAVCELQRRNRYDLILLDLHMPGLDGFQVMAGLQESSPEGPPPILAITAEPEHKLAALKGGARDFLSKPFNLAEVLLRVRNALEVRRLRRDENVFNQGRLDNSQRIAALGDWDYDFVRHRLVWSDEVYRILGLPRQEFPASSETFYRQVHPDDLAFVHREKKMAAEGFRRAEFEHRIIRPDGTIRHIHQVAEMFFDDQGRPQREAGTIQDITERKLAEAALRESEQRFAFVARAVSDAVWDRDLLANTLWWNDGFLTTFGFAAGEIEASVASWSERVHPEDRERVLAGIGEALGPGATTWNAEYRFRRKDGGYALVQDRGHIVRDEAGQAVRMVGGMRDLTEQRKLEAQQLRAQRMESIGTLAGGIAHDLNNVLAPIMMAIELLKSETGDDPRRRKILEAIHVSSRRGADLVRQVLSFARGMDGERVVLRLRRLLDDIEAIISETFPRSIRISLKVPEDLWPVVGDPTQLHQVLLNLAVNARDAMPHGGMLTLSATNVTLDDQYAGTSPELRPGAYVLLQVTDTGTGIPPEVRERIFEPFFTTKEFGQGTGIGLTTVLTIVKGHGGLLKVESEVGRGTSFLVYLPADPLGLATEPPPPVVSEVAHGRNELVLVIDDEAAIRDITRQTLETFGYRVLTASDGAEGVAIYAQHPAEIAVVITDMMMPVMDGTAAIQVLTRINPSVKIIAASGLAVAENVARATGAGAPDFLPKPYTAPTLRQLVRAVIDRPDYALAQ